MNGTKHANIMVVDDTPANLKLLVDMLTSADYEARPFTRGDMAIRAARNDPPELILLDINMPGMNGYEVCEELKSDPALQDVPVIFISALNETIDKVKAFGVGGVDYIGKPFQFEEVHSRIDTHLKLRHYHQCLQDKNHELEDALEELKRTQTQLVQSEKMASLGVLTAGLAHEINNPVNFIKTGIDGLNGILPDILSVLKLCQDITPETAVERIESINRLKCNIQFDELLEGVSRLTTNIKTGVERTVEIVSGLRIFSRLDENEEKKMADLHENIEATLVILRHQFKDIITIHRDFGSIHPILCFPAKLNQAFMNLLVNAVDAIKSKTNLTDREEIRIGTSMIDRDGLKYACIVFSDTGPGIPLEIQKRVFEPFYTTKDVGQGNGLGLAIAMGAVESHGGQLELESQTGTGTTFRMYIPYEETNHDIN